MSEIARLLLFPALIAAGWFFARRRREFARRAARIIFVLLAAGVIAMIGTGVLHAIAPLDAVHHWGAQSLVAAAWLAIPLAAGVLLEGVRRRFMNLLQCFASLVLYGALFASALSGYAGLVARDSFSPEGAEMRARFFVWHQILLPGFTLVLATQLCWYLRRHENGLSHKGGNHEGEEAGQSRAADSPPRETGNPYQSPRY